jgi:hypothetical protein
MIDLTVIPPLVMDGVAEGRRWCSRTAAARPHKGLPSIILEYSFNDKD